MVDRRTLRSITGIALVMAVGLTSIACVQLGAASALAGSEEKAEESKVYLPVIGTEEEEVPTGALQV